MSATGNTGQLYQKLVAGDTFNIATVLNDQSNKMIERMNIECNTVGGSGITIQLPTVAQLGGLLNFEVVITDTGNNATTRNITVLPGAGNTINQNASLVIATNKGGAFLVLGTQADWAGFLNANLTTGGGSGTVTSFSSGNLSPLFSTNVATATTTPALTFSLTNQEVNIVFAGPPTGVPAAPTFRFLVRNDLAFQGSATLDFPSVLPTENADLTITVTGAVAGDSVMLGVPNGSIITGTAYFAWVSAANTVTVRFFNYGAAPADPASGTFVATVLRS